MDNKNRADVNSIRPDDISARMKLASEKDSRWYINRSSEFISVTCPACNSAAKNTDRVIDKSPAIYNECAECKTLFITPRPTVKIYEDFYHTSEIMRIFSEEIFPQSINQRIELIYKPRLKKMLDYIKKFNLSNGAFLEIGAGSGVFSKLVADSHQFKKIIALEPSHALATDIRNITKGYKNFELIEKMVEDVKANEVQDVTVSASFEVIEHLFSPYEYLKAIYDILQTGGALFLSTPNAKGFDVLELKERSSTLGITHTNLFNTESIKILLQRVGFKILEVSTPGILDVDLVARAIKNGEHKVDQSSFIYEVLINGNNEVKDNFQKFLADNKMSSHMWVVAVK